VWPKYFCPTTQFGGTKIRRDSHFSTSCTPIPHACTNDLIRNPIDYSSNDAEEDWTRFILSLYSVEDKPNLLTVWLAGKGAEKIATLTDLKVKSDLMDFMNRIIGKEFDVPEPNDIYVSTN